MPLAYRGSSAPASPPRSGVVRIMGRTRAPAGGCGRQDMEQLALLLAEKDLEIRKLKDEKTEYKRKYDALTSTLKALADGVGHVAMSDAVVAASGACARDKIAKKDDFQDKNFPRKVHSQRKPVVADSFGKIHEKVEDGHATKLRLRREAYARDKALRAALSGPGPGPVAAVAPRALYPIGTHAHGTDDSSGASSARAQGHAGGQSSGSSGNDWAAAMIAAAAVAEEEDLDGDEETASGEPRGKKIKDRIGVVPSK